MVSHFHPSSFGVDENHYVIGLYRALGSETCALVLHVGRSGTGALQLRERGRAIIIGNLTGARRDEEELREAHLNLCAEYKNLHFTINCVAQGSGLIGITIYGSYATRANSIAKIEGLVSRIQQLPGFENFENGSKEKQMRTAAGQDTIVAINTSAWRSDAMALSSEELKFIPFRNLPLVVIRVSCIM